MHEGLKMNELIRELSVKAEEYADTRVDEGSEFHPHYTEKLAELIIDECLKLCSKEMKANDEAVENAKRLADQNLYSVAYGCQSQAKKINEMILKHFGYKP